MKVKAWEDAKFNRKIRHWGWGETVFFCISELVRKQLFNYSLFTAKRRLKGFKVWQNGKSYLNIGGAKLVDMTADKEKVREMFDIFEDTFLIPCYNNDNYGKDFVERLDKIMGEGPYGYTDGKFDVSVKKGDIVIDAGAWIGDFSAYAASKGATAYAFEPTRETYEWLQKTVELNDGRIIPVKKGLGDKEEKLTISTNVSNSGGNSLLKGGDGSEQAEITTIDAFVKEQNLERVDFIKADIEGFERNMLMGARETLRKFAPKLALCTYHLPDDAGVMTRIIKEANPDYTIVYLRKKLFAAVVK